MPTASDTLPQDPHNAQLISNVHPPDWKNPEPAGRYNLVVIGAGTAGLVSAAAVAGLGGKVALIERHLLGGDCLNFGCVPSKALIRSSKLYADYRDAESFAGLPVEGIQPDFGAAMERMRRLRARISHYDSARRFQQLGVDVFLGNARFISRDSVEVASKRLRFKKAVIATGSRPEIPEIEGLAAAGFLTNETVFDLTQRPARLVVIGGGPLGCELAQAFGRLGCHVSIVQREPQFLAREERDAAQILAAAFEREGIEVYLTANVKRVQKSGNDKLLSLETDGKQITVAADEILVGAGRAPNVEGLNLDAAAVKYDQRGIAVDDYLQTSNPSIYAAGDVCLDYKYTHTAEAAARIVVQNALFLGRKKFSALTIPWCTYTDPEIAHVGMQVKQAREKGIPAKTFTVPMNDVDRAITDSEEEGFIKIHIRDGSDEILGATIVARHAGDLISHVSLAMLAGIGLKTLSDVIHPYPTQAEGIKRAADAYNRTRLTPLLKRLSSRWLAWRR